MSLISKNIHIVVYGPDGRVTESQRLADHLNDPSLNILSAAYGNTFLDLLIRESYLTPNLQIRQILTGNNQADATRIIGNLAEALVVKYCNTYPEVNRALARYARLGERETKSLDNYVAIGTGSKVTEANYLQHYQPQDTQRDLIWIDRLDNSKQLACVGGSGSSFKPAGLQIKASTNGVRYIIPEIESYFYPILYFDLSDDWWAVKNRLIQLNSKATLIHPDEIMKEMKVQLIAYFKMVIAIFKNQMTILQLANSAAYSGDSILLAGLTASDITADRTVILHV